jgi:polygalacturonase
MRPPTADRRAFLHLGLGGAAWPLALPARPVVPPPEAGTPGVFEVTRFGAVGDGKTLSTEGLQRALDACGAAGGGTVLVPPGCYLTGALFLRSHVHLHLPAGATLAGSPRFQDYPPVDGREEGMERKVYASLLTGHDLEGVAVTGAGRLDGRGEPWWKADEVNRKLRLGRGLSRGSEEPADAPLRWPRPRMINLVRCREVLVEGVTLVDGPGVNIHLLYCEGVLIDRITVFQHREVRSSEAVIVDSTRRVVITACRLSAGADSIGIKSGFNEEGRRIGRPSEDILVTGCQLSRTSSGVVIGSETSGGVRNVAVTDCVIHDCLSGMRIRSPRGRGGVVEKVRMSNVVIDAAEEMGVKISHFFDSLRSEGRYVKPGPGRQNLELARSRKVPIDDGTPTFRDFVFSGLTLARMPQVALVEGLPERFIRGVAFEDITATAVRAGISCTMAAEVSIGNLSFDGLESPAVDGRELERLEIHRLRCARPPADAPLVWLENVAGAFIHGCEAAGPGWLEQQQCRDIALAGNDGPRRK